RNFELLDVPPPTEEELLAYYQEHREQYTVPRRAVVDEVRIGVGDDEQSARQKAEQALAKLRAGEEFAAVTADFSDVPYVEDGVVVEEGTRGTEFEAVVFALDEGQIGPVFQEGDAFHVVRLRRLEPASQQSLDEVRKQVWAAVAANKEATRFETNANKTLFTIHGQRYTVGEFYREYQELPPDFRTRYRGPQGLKDLAERLIERLLMVEDTYDRMLDAKNRQEIEEVRLDVLKQMLHQEEVDDRIEVSDEEVQQYYDQHQRQMVEPPRARIRYIRIGLGQTEDERQRAWERANQAYEKLSPGGLFGRGQGADFAAVAAKYSEDETTAAKGGQLEGWIGEGYDLLAEIYEHPFHEKVLGLKEGAISQPFEFGGSLYIVQVLERVEPRPLSLEEAQEWIRRELELQKHDELTRQLSQKLLEQAGLVVYDSVLRETLAGGTGS
ncbi:MAG TPA: peptidyl-prolyl cis-trans isomerase, partial [Anaerolineae bacterium]|nr:peptidyl-prolyl cis-trans isomerase [Anaerolineae bacterium]